MDSLAKASERAIMASVGAFKLPDPKIIIPPIPLEPIISRIMAPSSSPVETGVPAQLLEPGLQTSSPNAQDKQWDPVRESHLVKVRKYLQELSDKKAEFVGRLAFHKDQNNNPVEVDLEEDETAAEYKKAIEAIGRIYDQVADLYNNYCYGQIDLNQFKLQAKPFVQDESEDVKTLQTHRGVKEILINLLAAIFSAGIIYGIAALATGRLMVFKPATKAGQKANDLRESIDNAVAAPCA